MMAQAKLAVLEYIEKARDKGDEPVLYEIYIVWFCKTLQNWKALVGTTLPDGRYYEVTFNGEKNEIYLDVYAKVDNLVVWKGGE